MPSETSAEAPNLTATTAPEPLPTPENIPNFAAPETGTETVNLDANAAPETNPETVNLDANAAPELAPELDGAAPELAPEPKLPLEQQNWFVLNIRPNYEERAAKLLLEQTRTQGLQEVIRQVMNPTMCVKEIRNGKQKLTETKIYAGYTFVEVALEADGSFPPAAFSLILGTNYVGGFLSADPKEPEKLPLSDISAIFQKMEANRDKPKPRIEFEIGEQVRIKEGAFENYEGLVTEINPDRGIVKINVQVFGRNTPVEMEFHQVEKK
jgi:transcriptional antiterminator NusG